MDYTPLRSFDGLPDPHAAPPAERDPWTIWAIACAPIPPLVTLMIVGTTSHLGPMLVFIAVLLGTTAACVALARRDEEQRTGYVRACCRLQ